MIHENQIIKNIKKSCSQKMGLKQKLHHPDKFR